MSCLRNIFSVLPACFFVVSLQAKIVWHSEFSQRDDVSAPFNSYFYYVYESSTISQPDAHRISIANDYGSIHVLPHQQNHCKIIAFKTLPPESADDIALRHRELGLKINYDASNFNMKAFQTNLSPPSTDLGMHFVIWAPVNVQVELQGNGNEMQFTVGENEVIFNVAKEFLEQSPVVPYSRTGPLHSIGDGIIIDNVFKRLRVHPHKMILSWKLLYDMPRDAAKDFVYRQIMQDGLWFQKAKGHQDDVAQYEEAVLWVPENTRVIYRYGQIEQDVVAGRQDTVFYGCEQPYFTTGK